MIVQIDPASPVPVFEQLRSQIERLIVSGQLAAQTRLPPIRHLAADLGIAPGTVAKVYEALGRAGLVESARRHGTVVKPLVSRPQTGYLTEARPALDKAADAVAVIAWQAGLSLEAAAGAVEQAWARLAQTPIQM
ncbi:MAG: GntR family transcriptional regulator [Bifidobacteriaceae bacterium]|nr:GntR family transcriptional regulator [Bifidobacteriaceae bacterium]